MSDVYYFITASGTEVYDDKLILLEAIKHHINNSRSFSVTIWEKIDNEEN